MPTFTASYTNSRGKTQAIEVDAGDALQAKRRLRQRGIRVTDIKVKPRSSASSQRAQRELEQKLRFSGLKSVFERRPGIKHRAVFARKLSALVTSGVPIVRSLDLLAAQQTVPVFKRAVESVSLEVNQGTSLATAMRRWPQVFDFLFIAMVEAGEMGGVLDQSLSRLSKLLEDNAKLQNQIRGAMIYPCLVLGVALIVFLGLTIFFVPIFADLFETLGQGAELPWITRMMMNVSSFLRSSLSLYALAFVALAGFLVYRFYKTPSGRRVIDRILLKLPVFGDLILKTSTAKFCRTFSGLMTAGVPILLSLDVVKDITGNSIISDAISSSRQSIIEGIPLSVSLAKGNVFPQMAIGMLSIGEETGEIDTMISKVADFYEDEVEAAVKALTSLLEPAMIIVVGGVVGIILVSMYMPMFTIFQNIR